MKDVFFYLSFDVFNDVEYEEELLRLLFVIEWFIGIILIEEVIYVNDVELLRLLFVKDC